MKKKISSRIPLTGARGQDPRSDPRAYASRIWIADPWQRLLQVAAEIQFFPAHFQLNFQTNFNESCVKNLVKLKKQLIANSKHNLLQLYNSFEIEIQWIQCMKIHEDIFLDFWRPNLSCVHMIEFWMLMDEIIYK